MKYIITIEENEDYTSWNTYRAKDDPTYAGEPAQRQITRYKQQVNNVDIPELIIAINRMEAPKYTIQTAGTIIK